MRRTNTQIQRNAKHRNSPTKSRVYHMSGTCARMTVTCQAGGGKKEDMRSMAAVYYQTNKIAQINSQ